VTRPRQEHGRALRVLVWQGLMLVWLAFLIRGVWWMWPTFQKMEFSQDLIAGSLWLTMGAALWLLAFAYGRGHYWGK
jgi:hypothetical protein